MLLRCFCVLITLNSVASLEASQEKDNTCATLMESTQPAICISTPHPRLTVNRNDGWTNIYVSIRANRFLTESVKVTIEVSGPANPSNIQLREGHLGKRVVLSIDKSGVIENTPVLKILTSKENPTSGELLYTIDAHVSSSNVAMLGTPLEIAVATSP